MENKGRLYLIPNLIAPGKVDDALPMATIAAIQRINHFVVEAERAAWRLLSAVLDREELARVQLSILDEHTTAQLLPDLLGPALEGQDLGLLSEAGMPCIADPGAALVALAHERGIKVVPLVGPSSILLSLAASGLDGQRFRFLGYLPQDPAGRRAALRDIDRGIRADGATRIFIETPYRNAKLLEDCLATLDSDTRLCVAISVGSPEENIQSGPIAGWKAAPPAMPKEPAIFLVGRVPPSPLDRVPSPRNSGLGRRRPTRT